MNYDEISMGQLSMYIFSNIKIFSKSVNKCRTPEVKNIKK